MAPAKQRWITARPRRNQNPVLEKHESRDSRDQGTGEVWSRLPVPNPEKTGHVPDEGNLCIQVTNSRMTLQIWRRFAGMCRTTNLSDVVIDIAAAVWVRKIVRKNECTAASPESTCSEPHKDGQIRGVRMCFVQADHFTHRKPTLPESGAAGVRDASGRGPGGRS
jgi:hypothetical protein